MTQNKGVFQLSDVEKKKKFIVNIAYYALIIALILFAFKYALSVCAPIIFAFVMATLLQRPKNFLTKKTFLKSGLASTICVFAFILIVLALVVLIGVRATEEIKGFINYVALQIQNIDTLINTVEDSVLGFVSNLPAFISENVSESIATVFTQLREFIAGRNNDLANQITEGLGGSFSLSWITTPITGVISTASKIPSILIAVVISLVASCFMTSEYDKVKRFILCQFPEDKRANLRRTKALVKSTLSKMGKAYLLIMLITFIEIFTGLTILKFVGVFQSSYIVIIAIVIAIVDIVPMLGTGTILLPWIAYSLIVGNFGMAIGIAIIYAAITVIRQVIEPKFVAGQLGLSPVVTISAMYIGLQLFGFLGLILSPMLITIIKVLNDEGILHLWKSPSKTEPEESKKPEKKKEEKALPKKSK